MHERIVGITVLPEFVQAEGVDEVLDNLVMKAGANAVTTSPYVMEPADERTGVREPPDDAGAGAVRTLDRMLWEKRELFVRTAPSFVPQKRLYQGLRYQPAEPTDLTHRAGSVVQNLIRAAHSRHLKAIECSLAVRSTKTARGSRTDACRRAGWQRTRASPAGISSITHAP
jgi:hypothetical protein